MDSKTVIEFLIVLLSVLLSVLLNVYGTYLKTNDTKVEAVSKVEIPITITINTTINN
jgi:hypothetical protein